jgi:hypothetical protein
MKNTYKLLLSFLIAFALFMLLVLPTRPQAAVLPQTGGAQVPAKLPIYRLAAPDASGDKAQRLGRAALGISEEVKRSDDGFSIRSGSNVVEVDARSGAVWVADQAQMWNPELKPQLPDEKRARAIAEEFLAQNKLLPSRESEKYSAVSFTQVVSTQAVYYDLKSRTRTPRKLDMQVDYATRVKVPGMNTDLPVVGGGGEVSVTLGDQGKLIGYQSLVRGIEGVELESPVISRARADEQFKQMTKGVKLRSYDAQLAYYSAPVGVEQKFLYPVWVYRATATFGKETVPLRIVTLPATEFGPKMPPPIPIKPRTDKDTPTRRSTMEEDQGERERGQKGDRNHFTSRLAKPAPESGAAREGGTSFIGVSGGLGGSAGNAQGFVDGLSADGWSINFKWGDANAFESDWRRNDDSWVDAADFVFYTGHANMNGWVLSNPDDTFLDFSEVGASPQSPGDLWGWQDLEWTIIAACGPLQDNLISPGGGDVFARWDGAFDGLHQLLGYGAITFDNEDEGKRVVQYARGGDTLIHSWFRAAKEIQPGTNGASAPDGPTVWVGVMYVGRTGADPGGDHIWGHGSVSADPTSPTFFVAMWSPC